MPHKTTDQMLRDQFPTKHVTSLLRHFELLVADYQKQDWPDSIAKSGKFVEAVLKALWVHAGKLCLPERASRQARSWINSQIRQR